MKKVLAGAGAVLAILALVGVVYRAEIGLVVTAYLARPGHAFGERPVPPAPDYADPSTWAALPDRVDAADTVAPGATDAQATAAVDVFFVHPTTYLSADGWNQPLDDPTANRITDDFVMRGQASVFNGCCRVYAPRYRQATIASFLDTTGSGERALALALEDVTAAFRHYLEHFSDGRPFVLASHSQGSYHLDDLLAREIAGTELTERLVAAYLIGGPTDGTNGVPVCASSTQTGCQVGWNAIGPRAQPFGAPDVICVNPLSWQADETTASHQEHLGAVDLSSDDPVVERGVADARCRAGHLYVSEIRSDRYGLRPLGRDNYHIYDYALFYVNVRQNAQSRVNAFLNGR